MENQKHTPEPWRYDEEYELIHNSKKGLIEGSKIIADRVKPEHAKIILDAISENAQLKAERDEARRKCDALEAENKQLRTSLDTIGNQRDQLAVMVDKLAEGLALSNGKGSSVMVKEIQTAREMLAEFGNPHERDQLCAGLNESARTIYENNKAKGFWDKERNVGELLMLVTSELGEALEAHRKGRFTHAFFKGTRHTPSAFEAQIKDTFEDEIADAVIRLLDMAAGLGIDLEWHIRSKVEYNQTRPKLHGKQY